MIFSPSIHPMKPRRCISLLAFAACIATVPPPLCAATLNWDTVGGDGATITGGAGAWDTSNTNWNTGGTNVSWVNSNKDLAIFSGTAETVTLGSDITASGITFSSGYTIAGGGFTLTLDNGASPAVISKNSSGTISANLASTGAVSISGNSNLSLTGTNTGLTGTVSIGGANTVTLGNANALGTAAVTIAAGNQPALAFGGAFTLNNAVTLGANSSIWTAGSNTLTFGNNVTLAGNAGITLWGRSARFDGTLGLGANTFSVVQSGSSTLSMTLAGPVTGTGGITMNAASNKTLILANTAGANTYSGGTTITAGTVSIGTGGTAADTSHVGALGSGDVSINTGGMLRLWIRNNASFNIANNLSINGGTLRNEDGNHTMTGTVSVGTNGATFQSVWGGKNLTLSNTISGSGPVTVQANGAQVRFFGANTYTGATTVSNGTLLLSNASASSGFAISSGATLALRTITLGSTQNITGAGAVTKDISTFGASTINGNNNTYTGATTVNIDRFTVGSTGVINGTSDITVQAQWGANFNNLGSVTTPGNISVQGSGNTTGGGVSTDSSFFRNSGTVNAANINLASSATANTIANRGGSYSQSGGTTTVTGAITLSANGGTGAAGTAGNDAALNLTGGTINTPTLALDSGIVTATGGTLNLGSGGITSAGGRPVEINLGAATVGATAAWSTTLDLNLTDASTGTTFDTTGGSIEISGSLTGSGNFNKTGSGTLTLSGTSTSFAGDVSVSAGTLLISGLLGDSTTDVTVDGGTLGGTGTIGGDLILGGSSILSVVNLSSPLAVGGTLGFASSGFGIDNLGGIDWDSIPEGSYTLVSGALNETLLENFGYTNRTAVGTGGGKFAYFENGSLELVVIPEPRAALLGGLGLLILLRRRRTATNR
jgi:autotransporter-associated beta strand protein